MPRGHLLNLTCEMAPPPPPLIQSCQSMGLSVGSRSPIWVDEQELPLLTGQKVKKEGKPFPTSVLVSSGKEVVNNLEKQSPNLILSL